MEESTPHRPRLKIQKSQSSDAVLESDSESTPQHRASGATDSPPLWVENPNTLLRSSWARANGVVDHPAVTTPTSRLSRLTFDGPLSTVRDVIEENSENADEPNMAVSIQNTGMRFF